MASDRETLLSMGFDPARVDCQSTFFHFSSCVTDDLTIARGAPGD